jgi:5-formyltetrahydrofolate cyclo-ligase
MDEEVLRRRVKSELRKRLRGLRQTTPAEACAARSARIVEQLEALPALAAARTAALFWPMEERHEVDLRPLDAWLRERRVGVAYPSVGDAGQMHFRLVDAPLTMRAHGSPFAEPSGDNPFVGIDAHDLKPVDVFVIPAVAVDPTGHRIGYGAGYYDRVLARLAPGQVTIAVAFDFQLIPEVPVTPGDVPVRYVVTDRRVIEAPRPSP